MSQAYAGSEGNVLIGANDADVQSWSADVDVDTFDSTTTADAGWADTTATLKKISGSFEFFYNKTKKPFGTLGLVPGTTVATLTLYINKTDDEKLFGPALITKASIKSKTKEGTTLTCSFVNKGPWTLPS